MRRCGALVGLTLQGKAQRENGYVMGLAIDQGQVSAAVGGDAETHWCNSPFLSLVW